MLPMLLAGCVSVSSPVADKKELGKVCPAPTTTVKAKTILHYLETAPPSIALDVLATEWERLDEGARRVRN